MKKIYGLIGFAGLILLVGAAGGADNTSVGMSLFLMLAGLCMMILSEMFIRRYDYIMKCKRIKAGRKIATRQIKKVSVPEARQSPVYVAGKKNSERRIRVTNPEMC